MSTTGTTITALKKMFKLCPGIRDTLIKEHSKASDDFGKLWDCILELGDTICATSKSGNERESEQ